MSINEVPKRPEPGESAAPEQTLSNDIFDTMIQSFKEKQCPIGDQAEGINATENAEPMENAEELVKLNVMAKGGEHCRLVAAVGAADNELASHPDISKQIAKLEMRSMGLQKDSWRQEGNIRDTARANFSKEDMRELSRLGPNPLSDDPFAKKMGFEFNNAQRAWLKENHPTVYKLLEKHDRTSLEITNTNDNLRQLGETRDGPVNARIDLARYQHRIGWDGGAIATLTDAIRTNPSIVTRQQKGDEFRSLAMDTGAAWDPAFRKAVEHSGGNILDFVRRPMQDHKIDPGKIIIVPKPRINFDPNDLKK